MALQTLQNFYKATVSTAWAAGTGNRYVSVLPTSSSGRLVINPSDVSKREIVSYSATGTDGGGTYVTLSARGVGGTTDQTHAVNEAVRMNLTAQHYSDIQTELDLKIDDTQIDTDGTLAANSDTKVASQKATKTFAMPATYLDTDVALAANSDSKVPSQKAVKTYSDTKLALSNVDTDVALAANSDSKVPSQKAIKAYADALAIAGAPDASTTAKGIVEEATQAEVDARTAAGGTAARLFVNPSTLPSFMLNSDGSDGDVTISSGTTTLARDMYYDDLTVNGTGTLATAGYRVFVKGTCTVDTSGGGGGIHHTGGAGGAASGGTAGIAGTIATGPGGAAGTNGVAGAAGGEGNGAAGNAGTASTYNVVPTAGSAAGAGGGDPGNSGNTGGAGGAGGATSSTSSAYLRDIVTAMFPMQFTSATAIQRANVSPSGGGGGAGAGNGATGGGGGGSGATGGHLFISAKVLALTGAGCINANGGAGGAGAEGVGGGFAGGGGGGAGGNGGVVTAIYYSKTGTGTITANGGAGGAGGAAHGSGTQAGTAGTAGSAGKVIEINITT